MERTIQTKLYEFTQNNSGGHFDVDENVCHRVIIEAIDASHAQRLFEPMIENQSGSCSCCGDRWSTYDPDEIDLTSINNNGYSVGVYSHYKDAEERWFTLYGQFTQLEAPAWCVEYGSKIFKGKLTFDTIEQYLQYKANAYGWTTPDARIHLLDGTKVEVFKTELVPAAPDA